VADKTQVNITFDKPVTAGNYLQVLFTGVEMRGNAIKRCFMALPQNNRVLKDKFQLELPESTFPAEVRRF